MLRRGGGLVRLKYAPRTPIIFMAPAKILRGKRFVEKGATDIKANKTGFACLVVKFVALRRGGPAQS